MNKNVIKYFQPVVKGCERPRDFIDKASER